MPQRVKNDSWLWGVAHIRFLLLCEAQYDEAANVIETHDTRAISRSSEFRFYSSQRAPISVKIVD